MPFQRFVQTGRVAYVSNGPYQGKLVTIVDVIDQNRVLVDGPHTEVPRQQMRLSDLHLTKFHLKFPFTASTRAIRKVWNWPQFEEVWNQSTWAKKLLAKKKRADLTDFGRFKLRRAKTCRNKIRTEVYFKLLRKGKKEAKKAKAAKAAKATAK